MNMYFSEYLKKTIDLKENMLHILHGDSLGKEIQEDFKRYLDKYIYVLINYLATYNFDDANEDVFMVIEQDISFFETILNQYTTFNSFTCYLTSRTAILRKVVEYLRFPDKDLFKYLYQSKSELKQLLKIPNKISPISNTEQIRSYDTEFCYISKDPECLNRFRSIPVPIASVNLLEEY